MEKKSKTGKRKAVEEIKAEDVSTKKKERNSKKKKEEVKEKIEVVNSNIDTAGKKRKGKQATLENFNINIQPSSSTDFSKLPEIPSGHQLKIYSWNVNGLRATLNKGAIEKFIKNEEPDIFCFNETKIDLDALKREKHDKLYSESYMSFWNCCKIKSGYSGVAIFTKYRPLDIHYGIGIDHHDQEGRVLTLEFHNFYLVSVYVPNAGEGLKRLNYRVGEWDDAFFKYLHNLQSKKNVILCGDLNVAHKEIDIYTPKGHLKSAGFTIEERESFSKFLDSGYIDTFRHLYPNVVKFSYFSARGKSQKAENKGWRLDYFVIHQNALENLIDSEILLDYDGSDHYPVKLVWKN